MAWVGNEKMMQPNSDAVEEALILEPIALPLPDCLHQMVWHVVDMPIEGRHGGQLIIVSIMVIGMISGMIGGGFVFIVIKRSARATFRSDFTQKVMQDDPNQ